MSEEKVRVKVQKVLLESERQELKAQRRRKFLIGLLCFMFLIIGSVSGYAISSIQRGASIALFKTNKLDKITAFYKSVWLYKNDYENLEQVMEDKAFYGMSNFEEDPYSTYMSKDEVLNFASSINNNYVGIGAQYSYSNDVATITRVFKDSPAEKGGLMAGDIVLTIDDISIEGKTSDEIKEMIVGQEKTSVKMTVLRSGKEVDLVFIRAAIEYTAYGEKYDDYIYLNIMSFGKSTVDECIKYLDDCLDYSKIIIDLRDNSGGYQDSVQEVAGLFLGDNVVTLKETDNKGNTVSYNTICKKEYDNFKKIVVLTNEHTASAAEVLAICLKEQHQDATLVGKTTYGKGVVQTTFSLEDGSAIKITSSYWTSPNDVSINKVGVKPDIEISLDDILYENVYAFENDEVYELDSVSSYVRIAQMGLSYLDYQVDRTDGYFDESFKDALVKFKFDNNLEDSEILDSNSYSAIISNVIREYSLNKDKDLQLKKAKEVLGE